MENKNKYIIYWIIFLATLIYCFYEVANCPFTSPECSLNWGKFIGATIIILASGYGIYKNKDFK